MKKTLTLLFFLTSICFFGQNDISIEVNNASYAKKSTKISLDISIKNNTDSIIYIIPPKNYFFDKHMDTKNELNRNGLSEYPYTIDIVSNKKCKVSNEGYETVMFGDEIIAFNILDKVEKIEPHQTNVYKNIIINRFDGKFCSNKEYQIKISYHPIVHFNKEMLKEIKTKYDIISKTTKELNNILYYSLNRYKSTEKDNFKKLNQLFSVIPKLEHFNNKKFESNATIATQL